MATKTKPFDIAQYLETEEDIKLFLQEVANTGTPSDFIRALGTAAKAKSMTEVAMSVGVSRTSLYKSLEEGSNPSFITINKVVEALGCQITISAHTT